MNVSPSNSPANMPPKAPKIGTCPIHLGKAQSESHKPHDQPDAQDYSTQTDQREEGRVSVANVVRVVPPGGGVGDNSPNDGGQAGNYGENWENVAPAYGRAKRCFVPKGRRRNGDIRCGFLHAHQQKPARRFGLVGLKFDGQRRRHPGFFGLSLVSECL